MTLPPSLSELLTSDLEPGEAYRRCLELVRAHGIDDYGVTRAVAYATELRYVLDVLRNGRPPRWHNFGDPGGDAAEHMDRLLAPLPASPRVAFVGSGPFPVTALLLADQRPDARIACFVHDVVAWLLSRAV